MSRLPNEDLFEGKKMSFGEHLEELRVALVRSLYGLAIGVVIGFIISGHVIRVVVTPLEASLKQYYVDRTVDTIASEYSLDKKQKDQVTDSINSHGLVFEDVFIEKSDLEQLVSNPDALLLSAQETSEPQDGTAPEFEFVRVRSVEGRGLSHYFDLGD